MKRLGTSKSENQTCENTIGPTTQNTNRLKTISVRSCAVGYGSRPRSLWSMVKPDLKNHVGATESNILEY